MDAETAKQYTTHPVYVAANVLTTGTYADDVDYVTFDGDVRAAAQAYEMAGVGPEDLNCAELHDSFAPAEIKHYEDLGFCGRGEGARFLRDGCTDIGGKIVVNPSGGLLSKGHIIGATGISQWTPLAEMYTDVRHLRFADGPDEVHWMVVGRHELTMQ